MGRVRLEVVQHGEVVGRVESGGVKPSAAELELELPAGDGSWIAARAEAEDGTRAHTTPVYVVRGDLRFWKFDQVESLIQKRLASLAEIERIVAEARQRQGSGTLGGDRAWSELAEQAEELLERVGTARETYGELARQAERERRHRRKSGL
jgi:hypothetical protein